MAARRKNKWITHKNLTFFDASRSSLVVWDATCRTHLITLHHELPFVGHRGVDSTTALLKRCYHWPGMREDVRRFISTCAVCAANKNRPTTTRTPGLLQPIPHPTTRFSVLAMDFLSHLPKTRSGNDTILAVTDRATRLVKLIATTEKIDSAHTAALFRKNVFSAGCEKVCASVSERGGLKRLGLVTQRKRSENSSVCGERKTKKAGN